MIALPASVRVYLCAQPCDMRKSFDGLTGLVQECFGQDPLTGHLFLFVKVRENWLEDRERFQAIGLDFDN